MSTVITVHVALIALVGIILLVGMLTPKRKTAQRIFQLNAHREDIWKIITDVGQQHRWRTGLKKVVLESGGDKGAVWTEFRHRGRSVTYRLRAKQRPVRFEMETLRSGAFVVVRRVELRRVGFDQTVVTVTEYAEVGNPFTRVLVHLLFAPDDELEQYAKDLTRETTRVQERLENQTS